MEALNSELKHYGIQIEVERDTEANTKTDTYYVHDATKDSKIEPYDHLLEINGHATTSDLLAMTRADFFNSKLTLKLCKASVSFKSGKLKAKWLRQLHKDKYDIDEINLDVCVAYDIEILVGLVDKTKSKNLGISLEGTVDVDDNGNETYPHHYIRSVLKNGPVDVAETKFLPGDELLEIDFYKLYAINYLSLLDILKGLASKHVYMVCARKIKKVTPVSLHESIVDCSNTDTGNSKKLIQMLKYFNITKNIFNFVIMLNYAF